MTLTKGYLENPVFGIVSEVAESIGVRAFVIGGFVRDCFLGRKTDDIDMMIASSFDLENSESQGQWMSGNEVVNVLCRNYSQLKADSGLKLRLGKALRYLGYKAKHTKRGQEYLLSTRK